MKYDQQSSEDRVVLEPSSSSGQVGANAAVIWLHGLGADGFDFAPIVPELRLAEGLSPRFVFPHAPVRPVTLNGGMAMRAWYDIVSLDRNGPEDAEGITRSAARMAELIAEQNAAGVASERVVLAGFSQGGAIALHAALRHPEKLAGVLALSTYLPLRDRLAEEASVANRDTPILWCHGSLDPMVPMALGAASRDLLRADGYNVDWRDYPMQHQVCAEEIDDISGWLNCQLPPVTS